ncbi:FHA domain-containing protein [Zhongshania borealis]|uniref:FHA domain-containing protein n=1 Tax=Zhongshania borealis TaxID=889488 RepID=A0ABP7X4J4_9GAMM
MAHFKLYDTVNAIDHELTAAETSVGRSPESDIRLLSSSVSRNHGVLKITDNTLSFEDFGSSNGSYINTVKIEGKAALQNGDTLLIGDFELKVSRVSDEETTTFNNADDATQIGGYKPPPATPATPTEVSNEPDIPAMWSEHAGLEQASGTIFFSEAPASAANKNYRDGNLNNAPIGDTPRLVGLNLSLEGEIYPLDTATKTVWKIGRDQGNVDICLADSSISGLHAQLINEGPRWKVVNWMSTNGTFVNEQKGLSTYLKNGDIIRMGSAEFAFELPPQQVPVTRSDAVPQKKKCFLARLIGKLTGGPSVPR